MGDNNLGQQEQLTDIVKPHAHDVLSGRGNFVNHHSGNENFRTLVKHHKKAYVACPKAQKAIYSKIIYDEIRAMNPPGRFLKQEPKTKLWNAIGEKKALDKTRQALREGAPELLKEIETVTGGGGDGGGNANNGVEDYVPPLRMSRNGNPLAESLLGNISLGSFALESLASGAGDRNSFIDSRNSFVDNANSFTTVGANSFTTEPTGNVTFTNVPGQVGVNDNNIFNAPGTSTILAAAAQLQAVQQQQQQHQQQQQQQQHQQQQQQQKQQQPQNPEWDAQLQMLKAQMQINSQQANNMSAPQQGLGATGNLGNDLNAMLSVAQAQANNNNLPMGGNDMTALLAAIHNSANALNNTGAALGMGSSVAAYQQQLAQAQATAMLNQMNNDSQSTLITGNLNEKLGQLNNQHVNSNVSINNNINVGNVNGNNNGNAFGNNGANTFGNVGTGGNNNNQTTSFSSIASQHQPQMQGQQQQYQGGYQEEFFNTSVPLKSPSDSNKDTFLSMETTNNRRNRGGNLNSSFTRAQRIGLKNSFTRRPNRHLNNPDLQSSLKNSLMSIESLTLDDISDAGFSGGGMEGVFESESEMEHRKSAESKSHGSGVHDMSEVSELDFEDKD